MTTLTDQMNADALEAMKLTRKYFVVELDFSADSIQHLDSLCDDVDFTLRGGRSDENVELLTRVWGSYLGEVIRRHGSGQWIANEQGAPLLRAGDTLLNPHGRVHDRLLNGPDFNLWDFYQQATSGN